MPNTEKCRAVQHSRIVLRARYAMLSTDAGMAVVVVYPHHVDINCNPPQSWCKLPCVFHGVDLIPQCTYAGISTLPIYLLAHAYPIY
eukprot:236750-Rhodomonas_salina.1